MCCQLHQSPKIFLLCIYNLLLYCGGSQIRTDVIWLMRPSWYHLQSIPLYFNLWREEDSNLRPSGYGPEKLPLLYPAMFVQKTGLEPANPSEWQSDMRPLTPLLHSAILHNSTEIQFYINLKFTALI